MTEGEGAGFGMTVKGCCVENDREGTAFGMTVKGCCV